MTKEYKALQAEVYGLVCEAAAKLSILDIHRPAGWKETLFIIRRAWNEGRCAIAYWNNDFNYQRLLNTKKELEEALGHATQE